MSIIPCIIGDVISDPWVNRSSRLLDQHFGLGLSGDNIFEPLIIPSLLHRHYYRPWRSTLSNMDQGSTIVADKNKFEVTLDVQQFAPNEITVKAIDDNYIVVEGKHEEKKDDHGFISRNFTRRYVLPKGYDSKNIISNLSSDGVLSITAPKLALEESERTIPITQTDPIKKEDRAKI